MRLVFRLETARRQVSPFVQMAVIAPLVVVAIDCIYGIFSPRLAVAALMDEAAHITTAGLLIVALTNCPSLEFSLAALASSILIDIDHVPMQLGWDVLTRGTPRPYTHSVLSVIIAGILGLTLKLDAGRIARGVSFGVAAHLLRDVATGGGVSLFWPVTNRNVHVSYSSYIVLLCLLSVIIVVRNTGKMSANARELLNDDHGRDIERTSHDSWSKRLRLALWRKC